MVRRTRRGLSRPVRVPRASGDGPAAQARALADELCSPRERGWSRGEARGDGGHPVFPARAGMVPPDSPSQPLEESVPRASGDGPVAGLTAESGLSCSPRERGWSHVEQAHRLLRPVFPARAGMVRSPARSRCGSTSVPRASGDGPAAKEEAASFARCSPRERGWSAAPSPRRRNPRVFPARAGMVRRPHDGRPRLGRVPRASGDGPPMARSTRPVPACSPRERGWSVGGRVASGAADVFPARAGMVPSPCRQPRVPSRVPRASGDGPTSNVSSTSGARCSPRERGWSVADRAGGGRSGVFPARAGMVPSAALPAWRPPGVPRASGDGPRPRRRRRTPAKCSPRERGWSPPARRRPTTRRVFPARAGMVPPCRTATIGRP